MHIINLLHPPLFPWQTLPHLFIPSFIQQHQAGLPLIALLDPGSNVTFIHHYPWWLFRWFFPLKQLPLPEHSIPRMKYGWMILFYQNLPALVISRHNVLWSLILLVLLMLFLDGISSVRNQCENFNQLDCLGEFEGTHETSKLLES